MEVPNHSRCAFVTVQKYCGIATNVVGCRATAVPKGGASVTMQVEILELDLVQIKT